MKSSYAKDLNSVNTKSNLCICILIFLMNLAKLTTDLSLLFVFATEHTLLRIFFNIWRHILFPGDLHDDAL